MIAICQHGHTKQPRNLIKPGLKLTALIVCMDLGEGDCFFFFFFLCAQRSLKKTERFFIFFVEYRENDWIEQSFIASNDHQGIEIYATIWALCGVKDSDPLYIKFDGASFVSLPLSFSVVLLHKDFSSSLDCTILVN